MSGEPLKPGARGLLKPIERFLETTYVGGIARIDETRRLLTIDFFREIPMEKGVFDVELVNRPVLGESKG
jgi:hypothetical protein